MRSSDWSSDVCASDLEAITEDSIRNIYDIRVGVESMLGRRAAERVTAADIADLVAIEERYEELVLADRQLEAVKANIAFHARLYAIADNPEAEMLLEGRTRVVRTVADSLDRYSPLDRRRIIPEHRRILEMLEARRPAECGQAVFDHVTNARDRLLMRMRNAGMTRSEAHTSELQSLMRISYAVFCLQQ